REVTVYNSNPATSTNNAKIWEDFTKKTGIKVNLVVSDFEQLKKKIRDDGQDSQADILIGDDATQLTDATRENLLQQTDNDVLKAIVAPNLRSAKGYWYGLGSRAYVLIYAKSKIEPQHLKTYDSLTEEKFKGRILVGSSNLPKTLSFISAYLAKNAPTKTEKWTAGLVKNFARIPQGTDEDQIRAVAVGVGDIAIVSSDALANLLTSDDLVDKDMASKVSVFFPNQKERGVFLNIIGAGVTRFAPHRADAIALLQYLTSAEGQKTLTDSLFTYPVNNLVPPTAFLQNWGKFKSDGIGVESYGRNALLASRIAEKAGWH
ncbi:MAG: extracellular solute-binding protein, partial [Alphaproteobacteria bacterium]|nr:extracellular solute-binding protein [Alphaproteobacteria bacterium]